MAQNGYGPAPMAGHIGRIPIYGKTQVNPLGNVEPPACIQNAMMTKDKKPFTYTPGGLDLSQIRTPSMARRMARQRSLEEQEQAHAQQQQSNGCGNYHPQGGPAPPPPPPPQAPAPPPPPPPSLVIEVPNAKAQKSLVPGERPEIVIPENPIGMLRKTNSPYHWEAEKAERDRMGTVPKFVEKVPSPLTVQMPPSTFSQQPPQTFTSQTPSNAQRQNYPFNNQNNRTPESPIHRPEAQYVNQKTPPPNVHVSPQTREMLQRQDSQFNKSPQPYGGQSPLSNGATYSPSPNNNWKQPERRDSPASNASPQSPQYNRGPFSPRVQQQSPNYQIQTSPGNTGPVYHTLPRAAQRNQDSYVNNAQNNEFNNAIYNNTKETRQQSPKIDSSNTAPWRTNTLNRRPDNQQTIYHNQNMNQQQAYSPPWKTNDNNQNNANQTESNYIPSWKQDNRNVGQQVGNQQQQQQQYSPPWAPAQDSNSNNKVQDTYSSPWRSQDNSNVKKTPTSPPFKENQSQEQPRYQTSMSIPVTPKKQSSQPDFNNTPPQKDVVYINQEPIYYCPESPKSIPPWVKTQKEKTKTPPPAWCQKPLEGRKSQQRELVTPPREANQEPEWVRKSNEMQRGIREVISPPKHQQPVQPTWSTRPSENRKSLPRDNAPSLQGTRNIPIQMQVSSADTRDQFRQGGNQQPQLRIVVDMNQNQNPNAQDQTRVPYSQPTQRIMRVLSPQLVRLDDKPTQSELPTLNRNYQSNQDNQSKTRIIPIQIEGDSGGAKNRVYYHKFNQEGPPRQSKAFKVLQIITGTQDTDGDDIQIIENRHGYTDV